MKESLITQAEIILKQNDFEFCDLGNWFPIDLSDELWGLNISLSESGAHIRLVNTYGYITRDIICVNKNQIDQTINFMIQVINKHNAEIS